MLGKEPSRLNEEFNAVLDLIENQHENLFITGRAGTGKSTLLNILKKTSKKNAAVVAPTGIAALNVGGQTIHSFFKFPPKMIDPGELTKRKNHRFYKKLQLLIIDEISMVRADMVDCIDIFLRQNIENPKPFGGVQVVVFGDLFQLPPVVASQFERKLLKDRYGSPYFFAAKVFEEIELRMVELHTVYRQTERRFIKLLDNIRTRQFDYDDLEELNQRYDAEAEPEELAITLCSTNATVNSINNKKLKELPSDSYEYKAKLTGNFGERLSPADHFLVLKKDAQVMFVKNHPEGLYVNGTLGRIVDLSYSSIKVAIKKDGEPKYIDVEQAEWEMLKYELDSDSTDRFKTKIVGTFTQFPLRLAWAITIHKSQGKTFDEIVIDLGRGAFDHGQTYVALSRCRSLEGIRLLNKIRPKDIMVDQTIIDYYDHKNNYW